MNKTEITRKDLSDFIEKMQNKYNDLLNDKVHYNLSGMYGNEKGYIITGYKAPEKYINCACYIKALQDKQKCVFDELNMMFCDLGFELLERYLALTFKPPFTKESIKETIKNAYKCPITENDVNEYFNIL